MLTFIRSWGNSLKLLRPSNLKEWGLLALKGSIGTYMVLLKYFWWLLASLAVLTHLALNYKYYVFLIPYGLFVMAVWFFYSLLAARPSVSRKDLKYFVGYWAHGLAALVIVFIMIAIWFIMTLSYQNILQYMYGASYVSYFGRHVVDFLGIDLFLIKPLLFAVFFLCDTQLSIYSIFKSIWNGIKLLWYLLPICILIGLVLKVIEVVIKYSLFVFGEYSSDVFVLGCCLLFPIYLNILLYLYLKERYQHPERY